MSDSTQSRIDKCLEVVKKYIPYFKENFSSVRSEWKKDATRVTVADLYLSENILKDLEQDFPNDAFCSEEIGDKVIDLKPCEYAWVLDPVDGTNNFALGISNCCISIGLLQNGSPIYGVIYDLSLDSIIHGGPGRGAFLGNREVKVSQEPVDEQTLFAIQAPMSNEQLATFSPLLNKYSIRSFGSGALNMVYAGIGMILGSIEFRVRVWDIAASYPIAEGAGASIRFFGENIFPLEIFHTKLDRCPIVCGTAEFVEKTISLTNK
jgi:myo-inositol-1(or 4)-monophosphatase